MGMPDESNRPANMSLHADRIARGGAEVQGGSQGGLLEEVTCKP